LKPLLEIFWVGVEPKFFATATAWRKWLEKHHDQTRELLVGFYKRDSGKPSITWPEAVDSALCFGWIDGVRRRIDDVSYSIRFTPRKPQSAWSAINIKRVAELTEAGVMHPAGIKAFEARKQTRSGMYSYERVSIKFDPRQVEQFRANDIAWGFFRSKPPWYQRAATGWVISAKRPETRNKRLEILMRDSERGRTISPLTRQTKPD
jgi:uncharacterized protein YdeI (YjbR/CyaY-like superfamily)